MNRKKKVLLLISVLAVFMCVLVGIYAATAGKSPAVMNGEGGDHLWSGSAPDSLTDEQLEELRKDYPLAADATMEYFYYNSFEEFAEGIPIFALCTVEEQLEDYASELSSKQDPDFEQYVVKVDDCLWNHEESKAVADGKGIIVSHTKDDSQFIDLTEGSQVLIPLFAMGGSHTGRYSIANDVGYYIVDGYLLKAYDKDFDLNGLRWGKAKEEIERRLKEYNH